MGTLAKAALCGLYKYSGAMAVEEALAHRGGRSRLAILVFHRVTDEIPEDGLTVGTARFRAICDLLRRRFRVVPLGEVFRLARCGAPAPRRTVAVTIDDCYRDNLPAARVLAEHGLPACFFVPTAFVGTDHVFPWDRHLPRMPNLSWDDVREMARLGFEIGSHTVSHPWHANDNLVTWLRAGAPGKDRAAVRAELADSKATLEARTGRRIDYLAWPVGWYTDEMVELAKEVGYRALLTAEDGGNARGGDVLRIRRVFVDGACDLASFRRLLVEPAYRPCQTSGRATFGHTPPED